jgi:hypothetical protein
MGSFSTVELAGSRSYELGTIPGESSMQIVYLIKWTPTTNDVPTEAEILAACPAPNTRIPSGIYSGNSYLKTMVIRSVNIEPVREQVYTFRVTARASTRHWGFSGENDFCTCTRATVVRSTSLYRKGAALPTDGTVTFSGAADIGGSAVDTNGKAKAYEVPQQLVTIEVQYDRTLPSGSPAAEPPWATYTSYVGSRNDATFLGAPKGTMLYQGFQTAPIDSNYYRLSHTFLYDAWYHLEQIPAPNPSGEPLLVGGVSLNGVPILQVAHVVYLQKYDSFANFNAIVTAEQLAALTAPEPVAIP